MKRCESGCKNFSGGEIRHHKDCQFYHESLSEKCDRLESVAEMVAKFFDNFVNWEYADGSDAGKDFKKLFNLAKKQLKK